MGRQLGIDPNRILFFENGQPWLREDELHQLARRSGLFQETDCEFRQYVSELNQIIYRAVVTDIHGVRFSRSGVATIGETVNGVKCDPHDLSASRAMRNALDAAGFDPFKTGSVIPIELESDNVDCKREKAVEALKKLIHFDSDSVDSRHSDLARIHILAVEAGLIVKKAEGVRADSTRYYDWLEETVTRMTGAKMIVRSAASLDQDQEMRAKVIAALEQLIAEESV